MTRRTAHRRGAFSLTEVLLAIFIMGIGVIAIALIPGVRIEPPAAME